MHNYAYSYPGVGEERQYAIKANCEKTGCDPVHADNGHVMMCRDSLEAADLARHGIGGHMYELVTRVVNYPEWEETDAPDDQA